MGACEKILLILVTLLFPPIGVLVIAGCGADFCINICLTVLGYIPGHVHAFYIMYVYYQRREQSALGRASTSRAPGIYSDRVQNPGTTYGTV